MYDPAPEEEEPRDDFIYLDGPGFDEVQLLAESGESLLFDDEENLYD